MGLHPPNAFPPEEGLSQQEICIVEDDARLATADSSATCTKLI
ncbi:hypothetical protein LZ24_01410 [Desulfobotulus alkaliphilus]|uniref:Uncharacterized protein n=1 Tax=Desulfobotulus alkaliphilus TaxID=622671 RepID=A0A562RVB0_9BACT|nr:hypothetical protein [Desulfobotulus alkaliphilus]TWI72999.1 hypothetical protein LZ24_01410 [Desulfobotulus alkaliphilus]